MSASTTAPPLRIALIGNPNTGKSTLFGALAGVHQHIGNYPGATVEKKTGTLVYAGQRFELIDLPGLYSLAARSRDEMVAVDVLLGRIADEGPVDAVVCIADASNLERGFYLLSQVLELGLPTVLAVNMLDVAERREITLDLPRLERQLGVPVVPIQAHRQIGLAELQAALVAVTVSRPAPPSSPFPAEFEGEVDRLAAALAGEATNAQDASSTPALPRPLLRRLLLDVNGYLRQSLFAGNGAADEHIADAWQRLAAAGVAIPGVETAARYAWVHRTLAGVVRRPDRHTATATDRIDRWLTHRVWGTLAFLAVMGLMFQAVFVWATPPMNAIGAAAAAMGQLIEAGMAPGALRSLLVDGVIGGVGSVLKFLPQIVVLFLFIAVLEDCGYMARAACLMDRLMVRVGLSGRSVIPMLSSFACSVPGIMAARVIEDERDRLTTILVAPLLTCSARLPVYAMLIAAFVPAESYLGGLVGLQGLTLAALYLLGIVAAVAVALTLKRTLLRGETPPLLLELPSYKLPSLRTIAMRVGQRAWVFLRTAGTLILAISILVWAALYYPHRAPAAAALETESRRLAAEIERLPPDAPRRAEAAGQQALLERRIAAEYQKHSLLGRMGRWIEPAVRPLGWDWRIGCAVLASFPAREVVVATLGVMYPLGDAASSPGAAAGDDLAARLQDATWEGSDTPAFNLPVALSLMVFFALCAQCAATLAVIRRETNSWRWPLFALAYMTALAYVAALVTYQTGMWLSG